MAATWTAGITAAAGTRLTQSLFAKLFTFGKSFSMRSTLAQIVTLSRIANDS